MSEVIKWDKIGDYIILSENGLTLSREVLHSSAYYQGAIANSNGKSGKFYWEIDMLSVKNYIMVGLLNSTANIQSMGRTVEDAQKAIPLSRSYSSSATGSTIRIKFDTINRVLEVDDYKITNAGGFPAVVMSPAVGNSIRANFGATPFKYPIPEGYRPYNDVEEGEMPDCFHYSLIKSENKYYDIDLDNSSLFEVPFELESFINSNVNTETIKSMDDSGKLLVNNLLNPIITSISESDLMIEISAFRDIRVTTSLDLQLDILSIDKPAIDLKAIPKPQIIISKDNIPIPVNARIMDMNLIATENKGSLRIIFSTDDGVTWNTLNKEELNVINIDINNLDEVKKKGLNIDDFNNIGWMWDSIIKKNKIRFAYYLEIDSKEDKAETKEMNAVFTVISTWKKAKHKKAFNYEYTNTKLIVEIYNDGSYKINYKE